MTERKRMQGFSYSSPLVKHNSWISAAGICETITLLPLFEEGKSPRKAEGFLRREPREHYIFLAFQSARFFSRLEVFALAALPRTRAFSPKLIASAVLPWPASIRAFADRF